MKDIEKSKIVYGKELENLLGIALGEIKAMVQKNNYIIENPQNLDAYMKYNYGAVIGNSSKKMMKRLNKYIRFWSLKDNRESANRLLHFLKSKFTATRSEEKQGGSYYSWIITKWASNLETARIKPSIKEQTIQKKREVWKKLRNEADKALLDYKKEKGDFYKVVPKKKELELELELT